MIQLSFSITKNLIIYGVFIGIPIKDVPELKPSTYTPCGRTALFDAITEGMRIADDESEQNENERVICVIITDGEENCSRDTTKEQMRKFMSQYESRGNWAFIYIGKDPNRWTKDIGLASSHGISYNYNEPRVTFKHISNTVTKYRVKQFKQKMSFLQKIGLK